MNVTAACVVVFKDISMRILTLDEFLAKVTVNTFCLKHKGPLWWSTDVAAVVPIS